MPGGLFELVNAPLQRRSHSIHIATAVKLELNKHIHSEENTPPNWMGTSERTNGTTSTPDFLRTTRLWYRNWPTCILHAQIDPDGTGSHSLILTPS